MLTALDRIEGPRSAIEGDTSAVIVVFDRPIGVDRAMKGRLWGHKHDKQVEIVVFDRLIGADRAMKGDRQATFVV